MKKTSLIVFLAMFLIFCSAVVAQDEDEEKWRNFEVGINVGLTMPSNIDWYDSLEAKNGANYGLFGGYYFNERFCFGSYFTYAQMSPEEATSFSIADQKYKMYRLGFYGKYAFTGESNFEPYVKVSAGINFAKFATWVGPTRTLLREISYDPAFSGAAYLGLSYFTSDYGAIYLEVSYHMDKLKNTPAEYGNVEFPFPEDIKYLEANAGVVVFFGPE
ncbi:MAG: porin family protein [candidate division Zixibacteria bacterium]|nr:porin family protein [candidate division Zixibacteria bacterium]